MDSGTPSNESGVQNDTQRRAEALRRMADEATSERIHSEPDSPGAWADSVDLNFTAHPTSMRWQIWLAGGLIIVVVAATLAAVFLRPRPTQSSIESAHPVVFTPISDQVDCLTDMAWSSNAHKIAALGYTGGCPSPMHPYDVEYSNLRLDLYQGPLIRGNDGAGIVAIYDAQHGVRFSEFAPDSEIFTAIMSQEPITPSFKAWLAQADLSPPGAFAINYTHVLWAPGDQKIILVFTFFLPSGAPITTAEGKALPGHIIQGLLITDLAGQHAQVLLHTGGQDVDGAVIWDLATTKAAEIETSSTPFARQPPALNYTWTDAGHLTPELPVSANTPPATDTGGKVGAPLAGTPSFSLWQSGSIATTLVPRAPGPFLTGAVTFTTDFAALSPDGRYLIASVGLAGLVVAPQGASDPTLTNATLAKYGWQAALRLPLRDPGLRAAIALAQANSGESPGPAAYIAWRPDGKVIAVSAFTSDGAVKLFDTGTGKQLASLVPPTIGVNSANASGGFVVWSSDGRNLAYYNGLSVSLWSRSVLPA